MRFLTLLSFVIGSLAVIAPVENAQAQRAACDFNYTIQEGDTLADIAEVAYGRRTYTLIFARNFGTIVSPANLPAGVEIVLPCVPNSPSQTPDVAALEARMANVVVEEPQQTDTAPAATATAPAETAPAPAQAVAEETYAAIRILTSSGNAPYADENLRAGGIATELTVRALRKVRQTNEFEVVFINDREKHLRELVIKGSFDIAYPWQRPQCEQLDGLREANPEDAWFCENFEFSEPFFEVVSGFFILDAGRARRRTFEDFATASICRPSNEPIDDLNAYGIVEDFADFFQPKTAADCLKLLRSGFVDAAIGDVFDMEAAMFDLGMDKDVQELPELSLLTSIHAVAPKGNSDAIAALDVLNQGMLELKLTGEWFRVLSAHSAAGNR